MSNEHNDSRLFLLDFACILPYGHNAIAVNYFRNFFKDKFNQVVPIVCKDLPKEIDFIEVEARQLPFLYSRKMIKDFIKPNHSPFKLFDSARSVEYRKLRTKVVKTYKKDLFEYHAIEAYAKLFLKYKINSNDYFFFHSASYYEIMGLLKFLKYWPLEKWPNIHFRFIGVFEFANYDSSGQRNLYRELMKHFQRERELGINKVHLSAEVPIYAQKLSTDLGVKVLTTFYPPLDSTVNDIEQEIFTVACPGAGRGDKGFYDLKQILYLFYLKYPNERIKLIVQSINEKNINMQELNYLCQLRAIPNVEVLPHQISEKIMLENYAKADLILLPYSKETYQYRGSAVLQESISFQKPVISYDGTGFADLIKVYQNGTVAKNLEEIVECIYSCMKSPISKSRLQKIKNDYTDDFKSSYSNLW